MEIITPQEQVDFAQNKRLLNRYRYVEYEMLRVLAGWLPATARMELKLAIGRLLWEDAQHVQHLYGRLREIQTPAFRDPGDPALTRLMAEALYAPSERDLLAGLCRVIKPALARAYRWHMQQTFANSDAPTLYAFKHILLDEEEQRAFARLAVFAGGCTVEAAERVCEADLEILESLAEKSLIHFRGERFRMLLTIREYARECLLASDEADSITRRLAEMLCEAAETFANERGRGRAVPLSELEAELENIRVAIRAALAWPDDAAYRDVFYGRLVPSTAAHRSSMLQDLDRGRRTEIDAINGAVAARGAARGVAAPANEALTHLVRARERNGSQEAVAWNR